MRTGGPELALVLGLAVGPGPAAALTSDRSQPVTIEADQAELDDVKRVTTYQGRVIVNQGSLRITGDRMVLYYDENREVTRAESFGKPATYEQLPDGQKEPVKARASRMEYLVKEGVIELYGDAQVIQAGDSLTGSRITYDTVNDRVKATRAGDEGDRVRVILTPKSQGEKGQGPAR